MLSQAEPIKFSLLIMWTFDVKLQKRDQNQRLCPPLASYHTSNKFNLSTGGTLHYLPYLTLGYLQPHFLLPTP